MKYIIIGLGNYGGVLAEELSVLGHEVIGVDTNEHRVDVLKDKIATSFIIDATDEQSLSVLPLKDVDVVIVAIGENFGASVRVVALLKKKGVKHIYARAVDDVHKTVLEAFNLDSILTPEKEAARSLVQLLDLHVNVESFQIDESYWRVLSPLRRACITTVIQPAGKAANQTSNKKPPNSAVFYCLYKAYFTGSTGKSARAPHSLHAPSYSFTFGTSSVASANKTTAAVTPEPQLTIIGLS